jgi:Flp pilus assembly protein CpaB
MNQSVRNLVIALALAAVGIVLASSYLASQRKEIQRGAERVSVYYAKKDIPAGTPVKTLLDGRYLETRKVERSALPAGPISKFTKDLEKQNVNSTVYAGEALTETMFEERSALNPADQIRGNERLFLTPVSAAGNVADLIQPGDHVDVFAYGKEFDPDKWTTSWFVARNVLVVQTPASLAAEGASGDEEAEKQELDLKGDPQPYLLQATDKVAQDIHFAVARADDGAVHLFLRPGDGAQDSSAPAIMQIDKKKQK